MVCIHIRLDYMCIEKINVDAVALTINSPICHIQKKVVTLHVA